MLKVFFGTDTDAVRKAAWAAARDGAPDAPHVLTSESYEPGQLSELVGAGSLFGEARVVVIDTPTEQLAEDVSLLLDAMAASVDRFIIIEGPLLAATKKVYAKHTDELHECKAGTIERFNTFALADALASRNKKQLWLLLHDATRAGIAPEEITGVLWWQLKGLRLAALTSNAAEAGMKDFPYNKAKRALATLSLSDVEQLSHELLTLYHQGHGGETDFSLALEHWVLST
jgi:DNA polymerase III delta subunit